jgi:hypothetical protein
VEISGFEDYPTEIPSASRTSPKRSRSNPQQNAERTVSIRDSHTSSSKQDKFLNQITLVVVMTAVEMWKAPKAP